MATADISCPYCGEVITLFIDEGGGAEQRYIEDCQVCCRPINVTVAFDDEGDPIVNASAENDVD
jgi:hypothetical protein